MVPSTEIEEAIRANDREVDVEEQEAPTLAERGNVNPEKQPGPARELPTSGPRE